MAEPGANPGGEARGLADLGQGEAAADLLYKKVDVVVDCGVIVAFLSLLLMILFWLLIVAAAAAYLREAKKYIWLLIMTIL